MSSGLRLRGVSASWTGATVDLAPLDLDIPPGTRLAVVGSNGSGKSTLLAVLARQLEPVTGSYTIAGVDAGELTLETARASFAIVDDEPHIFAATLRANLALAAPGANDAQLGSALRAAGLGDWFAGLPEGLDTLLGSGGRGISGGERARLALARALASGRPVILLDEPLAHLDHATATGILRDVTNVGGDRTIVMVSHRPEGLDLFDDVLDLSPLAPDASLDTATNVARRHSLQSAPQEH